MTDVHDAYFRFATRDEALAVAEYLLALGGTPSQDGIPPDGWVDVNHFDLVDVGVVYEPVVIEGADPKPLDGYHVIMRWRGKDMVPEKLLAFEVEPWGQDLLEVKDDGVTYIKETAVRLEKASLTKDDLVKVDISKETELTREKVPVKGGAVLDVAVIEPINEVIK